ncbi:MAG TPA: beta-galactosidase GalA [Candidatus Kryptonia bacterium]
MKPFLFFAALLFVASSSAFCARQDRGQDYNLTARTPREKLLLDPGWKFHLGNAADLEKDFGFGMTATFSKAGWASGPARPEFSDSTWRTVDLPHDWAVEIPIVYMDDDNLNSHGYKPVGRRFPETSIGWYRRSISIPKSDSGNRVLIKFDGVFRDCMVWLNGFYLGRNESGYGEFNFDVTDYVEFGEKNVLVVRVDATEAEGWFYEGAGIYRHVWLIEYSPLHIPLYGTYAVSDVRENVANFKINTEVANQTGAAARVRLVSVLLDSKGNQVGSNSSAPSIVEAYAKKTVDQQIKIPNPHLWSLEDPYLYKLVQLVESDGKVADRTETSVGIRTVRFDKDNGFFLNGKHVEIQGVCCHQDHAGVGSALPDGLQIFRIKKLKEMGVNAYRTSHNPPTPELLDACDSLGMLVLDENRLLGSTPIETDQLKCLILRDRNHPSVIAWSIGNEEWRVESYPIGALIARTMKRVQEKYDPSRVCTFAADNGPDYIGVNSVVDVRGVNYIERWLEGIDRYHREHPDQPMWGSEESSAYTTRGVYRTDTVNGYVSDYDVNFPYWGGLAEKWWNIYKARPWLAGGFVWTGFDYRGEPTPYGWPDINSNFGILDMCGFPKNAFYYYESQWTDKDVLHIFPHWNWAGKEGKPIDVWCYSNCDSVELFLNGASLGRKIMPPGLHLDWSVLYSPGTLEAFAWRNGRTLTTKLETTGAPVAIRLTPDRSSIRADGEDVSVVTVTLVDSLGREVPDADNLVHFESTGAGQIIGVGNGNPSSHEADKYLDGGYQRRLFSGKCEVILESTRNPGTILLKATGDGIRAAAINVNTLSAPLEPVAAE